MGEMDRVPQNTLDWTRISNVRRLPYADVALRAQLRVRCALCMQRGENSGDVVARALVARQ